MKKVHEPYHKLKNWLRENRVPYREIADFLGLTIPTVAAKINGDSDFYLSEVQALRRKYGLSADYFYTGTVA
ncbi:MAG: hypothetical protein IJX50_00125 [Clostridia bacterium]|nr:hypothetical protein [Clostridia bacterium]